MHCLHILDPRLHKLYIAKSSIKYLVNIMQMKKADIWYHHSLRPAGNPGTPVCYHLLGEKPAFGWWFPQILRSLHIPVCCRRSWLGGLQEGHHPPELNHPVVSLLHISREHVSIDTCVLLVLYGPKLQSSDLHRVYIVFWETPWCEKDCSAHAKTLTHCYSVHKRKREWSSWEGLTERCLRGGTKA